MVMIMMMGDMAVTSAEQILNHNNPTKYVVVGSLFYR